MNECANVASMFLCESIQYVYCIPFLYLWEQLCLIITTTVYSSVVTVWGKLLQLIGRDAVISFSFILHWLTHLHVFFLGRIRLICRFKWKLLMKKLGEGGMRYSSRFIFVLIYRFYFYFKHLHTSWIVWVEKELISALTENVKWIEKGLLLISLFTSKRQAFQNESG